VSAIALPRDTFAPRQPPGMRSGLALAIIVHMLLIAALTWSVRWKTSEPEGVTAELWAELPQTAAPRAVPPEPKPPAAEPRPAPPLPKAAETATSERGDAQIAIERAARERAARDEAQRAEAARRDEQQERERERLADEQAEKKKLADKARQDEARLAAIREANLRKMMSQAGASEDPAAAGRAAQTAGPSANYAGRIKARIKPNIVLTVAVAGNPLATVEVRLAPDGTIVGRKLVRPSGSPAWDETVLRAIEKTEILPRDLDGRVPASITIDFRPLE
jgi:colicin import membrane protein